MSNYPESNSLREPTASRPYMPDYGVLDVQSGKGLLPWSWAVERLEGARNYWLATCMPDGMPHLMPVWGIWLDEVFYFSTGRRSRKARNLEADSRCVVSTDRADEPVVVEGLAMKVIDPVLLQLVAVVYNEKYKWTLEPVEGEVRDEYGNGGPVYAVYPQVAFGFGEDLTGTATRWTFP